MVFAVCAAKACAEDESVVEEFEGLGADIERDDTKANKPVIGLRFGLRPPIPDTTSELVKNIILSTTGLPGFGMGIVLACASVVEHRAASVGPIFFSRIP